MSVKRILALAQGGPGDSETIGCAAWLAAQHDAVAHVVPLYPDAAGDLIGFGLALGEALSPEAIDTLARAERGLQDKLVEMARQAANAGDVVYGAGESAASRQPRLISSR